MSNPIVINPSEVIAMSERPECTCGANGLQLGVVTATTHKVDCQLSVAMLGASGNQARKLYECGICDAYHPQSWDGDCRDDANRIYDIAADDEVISWEEQMGQQGNQARLNNGCVCDSGCDSCARLAEAFEALEDALSRLLTRYDALTLRPVMGQEISAARAALRLADRVKEAKP